MQLQVFEDRKHMAKHAAEFGAEQIRQALAAKRHVHIIVATGLSQMEMLHQLTDAPGLDWRRVSAFHLDEYIGLSFQHPASFRNYLWKHFASRLPVPLAHFEYIQADSDAEKECKRLGAAIADVAIDVAFVGIGENGHLAFNDPPADFVSHEPYLVVSLDKACRQQQVGEGWFASLDDTPQQAITMSIHQIMQSHCIVCTVPEERKAAAVARTLGESISPHVPASILRQHQNAYLFLDAAAAMQLPQRGK